MARRAAPEASPAAVAARAAGPVARGAAPAARRSPAPRRIVVSGVTVVTAFGLAVTGAMSATAAPLPTGTEVVTATATVAGQSYTVGDVDGQTISWDSYGATSASSARAAVSSSEVAAAVAAATAQLATAEGRSETASEVAATTTLKSGDGAAMVAYALQYVGKVWYVLGGTSPSAGFSCDTFVEYVYAAFGTVMTGDVDAIATHATVISASEARAGDLVYYPHEHIGIYDGAGGIIDAPKPGRTISHRAVWGTPTYLRITS